MKVPGGWKVWKYLLWAMLLVVGLMPFLIYRGVVLDRTNCSSADCLDAWPKVSRRGKDLVVKGQAKEHVDARRNAYNNVPIDSKKEMMSPGTSNDTLAKVVAMKIGFDSFMSKVKSWITKVQRQIVRTRMADYDYLRMATIGTPYNLHCLSLMLAEEYSMNNKVRGFLFPPQDVHLLFNKSYHHVVIISDNVIATRVAVMSAVNATSHPEKLVFHVVTDSRTFIPMHAWFALNPVLPATLEVKGLHHFNLSESVVAGIAEMMEFHRAIQQNLYRKYGSLPVSAYMDAFRPTHVSLLNHLRIYLPELFPELAKILFLDDDVLVQKDLSPLWSLDLDGCVIGAVQFASNSSEIEGITDKEEYSEIEGITDEKEYWPFYEISRSICADGLVRDYLNFSTLEIRKYTELSPARCAWLYGVNIFDLDAWRSNEISQTYHKWLRVIKYMDYNLWRNGALPPALIAFDDLVYPLDSSWHLAGLGGTGEIDEDLIEAAAVLHFSGPGKPWLPFSSPKFARLWNAHVNHSNPMLKRCEQLRNMQ